MHDPNRPSTGYLTSTGVGAPPPNPNGYGGPVPQPLSGTAYPYAVERPSSAAYYQPNHYAAQRATCFRRVIGISFSAVALMCTFILVLWLILRPKPPEFTIDSFSVSNLNLSESVISANWELHFTVRNPNKKMTLHYDDFVAAVSYESALLSDTTVPPFFQEKRVQTAQKASFATSGAYVDNWVFDGMNKERSTKGAIGFNVRMVSNVRFKAGAWRARRRSVRVYCNDLSVGVGSNNSTGSLLGGSRQCRVVSLLVVSLKTENEMLSSYAQEENKMETKSLSKATSAIQEESAEEVPVAADVLEENKIESKPAAADASSLSAELCKETSASQEEVPIAADALNVL